jgi:hypothetical protein
MIKGKPFVDALGHPFDPSRDVVWTVTDLQGISADFGQPPAGSSKSRTGLSLLRLVVNASPDEPVCAPSSGDTRR